MLFLTSNVLRLRLGVSSRTLSRWVKAGILPQPLRINRLRYWNEAEIAAAFVTPTATPREQQNAKLLIPQDLSGGDTLNSETDLQQTASDSAGHNVLWLRRYSHLFKGWHRTASDRARHGKPDDFVTPLLLQGNAK